MLPGHPLAGVRSLLAEICSNELADVAIAGQEGEAAMIDRAAQFDYMTSLSARIALTSKGISALSARLFSPDPESTSFRNLLFRITDKLYMRQQLEMPRHDDNVKAYFIEAIVTALADWTGDMIHNDDMRVMSDSVIMPAALHDDLALNNEDIVTLLASNRWLVTIILFNLLDINPIIKETIKEAK